MNITTVVTSKSQITIPKYVREELGLEPGVQIDILPGVDGTFVGRPKRKSNIMKFAGSLSHLDNSRSWKEIREETERLAAQELVSRYNKLIKGKNAKLYRIRVKK